MKRRSTFIVALILFITISIVGIKAISMEGEYSDNIARYVLRSGSSVNMINKTTDVKPNSKLDLNYKIGSKYKSATYTSSNTKVATVNKTNGKVSFKTSGTVTIYINGSDKRKYKTTFRINSTYAIVSIKNQNAKLYVNGKLRRTAQVVTGMANRTPTPKGTFKIAYKQRNTFLDGATVGYDYYLPVKYWIPLAGTGGVGLHDASWRSAGAFGKSYYKYDGSHGCINMKTKDVAYFYKYLKAGSIVKVV